MKMTKKLIKAILKIADELDFDTDCIKIKVGDDIWNNNTIHPDVLEAVEKKY